MAYARSAHFPTELRAELAKAKSEVTLLIMWERESNCAWWGSSLWLLVLVFSVAACGGRTREHARPGSGDGGDGGSGAGGASGGEPSEVCACPDQPTRTWIVDPSCVDQELGQCRTSLRDELGLLVAEDGGLWSRGCGRSVVVRQTNEPANACVYDGTGALVGAFRSEPTECPGVDTLETADVAGSCADDTTCWLGPDNQSNVTHCDDASSVIAPECSDYEQSSLSKAYELLGGQPDTTLESYLAGLSDPSYFHALVGCGITAVTWYGLGATSVVFGNDGQLIGFDLGSDGPSGPCRTNDYRRGVVPPNGCDDYRDCKIAPDPKPAMVCAP